MTARPVRERLASDPPKEGTVTAIDVVAADPNFRKVRVDNRVVATLRALDVHRIPLNPGCHWTEEEASRVHKIVNRSRCRRIALQLLGRRGRSEGELRERLAQRGFDPETVDAVIEGLVADGWVDDDAPARELAEEMLRRKPAARRFVVEKLLKRGIESQMAEKAADEALAGTSPIDAGERLARARLARMTNLSYAVAGRRIAGLLARRGFDEDTIAEILQRLRLAFDETRS